MRNTLSDLARWLAIGGLWAVIGLAMPLTLLGQGMSALGLSVAERAKARLNRLRAAAPD